MNRDRLLVIETADVLAALVEAGVDAAQGDHIGRPTSPERIAALVVDERQQAVG